MQRLWAPWRMSYLRGEHTEMNGCIFCEKLTCPDTQEHILHRGKLCYVTLNRFPYTNGHLLVVPYTHTGLLEALDDATLLELMQLVRYSIQVVRQAYNPDGFNIGVNEGCAAGAGVPEHVHLHIVPRWGGDANYMTTVGGTRIIPDALDNTYAVFKPLFDTL